MFGGKITDCFQLKRDAAREPYRRAEVARRVHQCFTPPTQADDWGIQHLRALRLCRRRRAGLLERVSARECIDPRAVRGDAGEGREWRETDLEEIGASRLAGNADIGHRDLLAVAISSGFL